MKRIYNYMLIATVAFASVACIEDLTGPDTLSQVAGNDVQFGLSLEVPDTKTIYGPETNYAFPIYWSQGDRVLVASPQCLSGRNSAEYVVTPVSGQSYAEAMTKTGAYGVQWGGSDAVFYSIYPSSKTSWKSLLSDEVIANLNVAADQNANFVLDADNVFRAADMSNVIMYAQTEAVLNGSTVNLNYKPYSTVIEFELNLGEGTNGWGNFKVVSMTLTAPTNTTIAGDFTLKFNGSGAPTVTASGNNSNEIKVNFTTQPVLNQTNSQLRAKFALLPISMSIDDWTVSVEVLEGTDTETKFYTKKLKNVGALAPGKIHKIKLPTIAPKTEWKYTTDKWVTTLYDYKTIYLTELSIPGAWYALGKDGTDGYQESGHSAQSLWNAGIRAFAIECRSGTSSLFSSTPDRIFVSGTARNSTGITGDKWQYGGTRISDRIAKIAGVIPSNEFGVLVLSYADGGSGGQRAVDHQYFINGIQKEIAASGADNIYDKEITANTTIEDVLGKLIIKVNVDDNLTKGSYADGSNLLFSYNPFLKQIGSEQYSTPLFSKMYWKSWEDKYKTTVSINDSDFLWCFTSANRTHTDGTGTYEIPTYAQRKEALLAMIEHSREITDREGHNVWFYFNAGGTEAPDADDDTNDNDAQNFAANMNEWLYNVVKLKANGGTDTQGYYTGVPGTLVESDPSPLGIVMFNRCTDANYNGANIIKEIVEMNNKFKLMHKVVESRAPSYALGMDTNDSAFGWD